MKVGYIRVSSKEQNVLRQKEALRRNGCEKLFIDKESGKNLHRKEYKKMKQFVREKDIIVFAELDRLGRNKKDIDNEWNYFIRKGINIVVLDMPLLDTSKYQDDMGKLMMNLTRVIVGYMAEQERKRILKRQQQGIAVAKKEGKYKDAQKLYRSDSFNPEHRAKFFLIKTRLSEKAPVSHIAEEAGVSRNTVYRIREDEGL